MDLSDFSGPNNIMASAEPESRQQQAAALAAAPLVPPPNPVAQPSRKAKQHRKRHALPGPAGLMFQQTQSPASNVSAKRRKSVGLDPASAAAASHGSQDECEDDAVDSTRLPKPNDFSHNVVAGVAFYSPAWMVMQIELGIRTPSLQSYLSQDEKYKILRPFYPEASYCLIPDILNGLADWNLSPRSLLVVVQTSQALTDNLWTVSLMDETCATMDAWIQPTFVKSEQQQNTIYPGLVWLIQDATVMLVANKDRKKTTERMLLIKQENVQQFWSPAQADRVSDTAYRKWADERDNLTVRTRQKIRESAFEGGGSFDRVGVAASKAYRSIVQETNLRTVPELVANGTLSSFPRYTQREAGGGPLPKTVPEQFIVQNKRPAHGSDFLSQGIADEHSHSDSYRTNRASCPPPVAKALITDQQEKYQQAQVEATSSQLSGKHPKNQLVPAVHPTYAKTFSYTQQSDTSRSNQAGNLVQRKLDSVSLNVQVEMQQVACAKPGSRAQGSGIIWKPTDEALLELSDESDNDSVSDASNANQENMPGIMSTHAGLPTASIFQLEASGGIELEGFSEDDDYGR